MRHFTLPQRRHLRRPGQRIQMHLPARVRRNAVPALAQRNAVGGCCRLADGRQRRRFALAGADPTHRNGFNGCASGGRRVLRHHRRPEAAPQEGPAASRRRSATPERAERGALHLQEDG